MSKVVFLVGPYFPNFSAVGYCAYRVLQCLADDFDITVIAFRDDRELPLEEEHDGIRILRIETSKMKKRNALTELSGRGAQIRLQLHRAMGAMERLLAPETIDKSLVKAYLNRINGMDCSPSAIVPLVFPFETVLAALYYKQANPGTLVLPYLFDDFVESGSLHVLKLARMLKRKRHLALERRMLIEANAVLAMHPLRQHLETHFEKSLIDEVSFLEHPLLSQLKGNGHRPTDEATRLCFTGSLIRGVREPDYLLDILKAIQPTIPMRADFFVMGNAGQRVPTVTLANGVEVINHGRVPKTDANAAVCHADILLNIGEAQGRQVSSKVFEYMSSGKPIIHLAYLRDDAVTKILEKYPLALCIVQDRRRFNDHVQRVTRFIAESRFKSLTYEQVTAIYPEALPETTATVLRNALDCLE